MIIQIQMFEEQWTKKVIWLICLCVIEFYVTIEFFFVLLCQIPTVV